MDNKPLEKTATPLMQQYLRIKEKHPQEVLFFRLGDFYEMFFEDAVRAAPLLEVTLTQRQSIPMCGVPHHAVSSYLGKLLKAGVSVAIAEQLEDPKKTKGMVKRDVVRVMTPGTLVEDELLPSKSNNFLVAIAAELPGKSLNARWGLCSVDVSTGQVWTGSVEEDPAWNTLKSQLTGLSPSEVLLVGDAAELLADIFSKDLSVRFEPAAAGQSLKEQAFGAIKAFVERNYPAAVATLREPQDLALGSEKLLFLDQTAIRHLELVNSSDPSGQGPTLLSVMDKTVTPMGGRLLRWWVLHPSTEIKVIQERQNHVESFLEAAGVREELRDELKAVPDFERIYVRAKSGVVSPRELASLRHGLASLSILNVLIGRLETEHLINHLAEFRKQLRAPAELAALLVTRLSDEPPAKIIDGGAIREGVNAELDELRGLKRSGKKWIAEMEAAERERTGIGSLKVGYNDIFGYFLEVSRTNLSKVPPEWIRKQTMANGERYITPALKEQEEKILNAEQKISQIEQDLFAALVKEVAAFGAHIVQLAQAIAYLDVVSSLALAANLHGWTRPAVENGGRCEMKDARHPVIEKEIGREKFIPNDLALDAEKRIVIITGPNMAGKSTYLRQTALLIVMAQMGSFIPAEAAVIGVVDKIFTRIGASDRLAQGQSTFMVEMQEVAALMRHATPRSLLILDEVGRGTSTYDGMSIAWAVIEWLSRISPRTLFATHYFELTQLAQKLPNVKNAHATAKEWDGPDGRKQVVFLYQIKAGAADQSYGIHVAEMAGLPTDCIDRARQILSQLEGGSHKIQQKASPAIDNSQLDLFGAGPHPLVQELQTLKVNEMTPLEALNKLSELTKRSLRGA